MIGFLILYAIAMISLARLFRQIVEPHIHVSIARALGLAGLIMALLFGTILYFAASFLAKYHEADPMMNTYRK